MSTLEVASYHNTLGKWAYGEVIHYDRKDQEEILFHIRKYIGNRLVLIECNMTD